MKRENRNGRKKNRRLKGKHITRLYSKAEADGRCKLTCYSLKYIEQVNGQQGETWASRGGLQGQ